MRLSAMLMVCALVTPGVMGLVVVPNKPYGSPLLGRDLQPGGGAPSFRPAVRQTLRGGAPSMVSPDFGMKVLAPLLGNIIGTSMFLSSMPAVLKASKEGKMGSLNPTPFPAQIGNCLAWLFYAIHIMNWWIIVPNCSGILIALFYTVKTYPLLSEADKKTMTKTFSLYALLFAGVLGGLQTGLITASTQTAFGLMANFCLLFYYAAPMTTLATVFKTKDASSIDLLLAVCGTANGAFWAIYGLAIKDLYVWVPNAIGAVLALFSTLSRLIIGVKKTA